MDMHSSGEGFPHIHMYACTHTTYMYTCIGAHTDITVFSTHNVYPLLCIQIFYLCMCYVTLNMHDCGNYFHRDGQGAIEMPSIMVASYLGLPVFFNVAR